MEMRPDGQGLHGCVYRREDATHACRIRISDRVGDRDLLGTCLRKTRGVARDLRLVDISLDGAAECCGEPGAEPWPHSPAGILDQIGNAREVPERFRT